MAAEDPVLLDIDTKALEPIRFLIEAAAGSRKDPAGVLGTGRRTGIIRPVHRCRAGVHRDQL